MRTYKREFNVYEIVNDIDDKVYIGSTITELYHRFSQHKADARKGEKSPLYDLMRQYGIEHFRIQLVLKSSPENIRMEEEKVINSVPPERRLNYKKHSSKDGSKQYDYEEIIRVYKECGSQNMTANIVGCSRMTVTKAIKRMNVTVEYPPHTAHKFVKKKSA